MTTTRVFQESKPHGHALNVHTSRRPLRILRSRFCQRLACAFLVLVGIQSWLLHSDYREALAEKYSPTLFTRLSRQDEGLLTSSRWHLGVGDQYMERQGLLRNKEQWKTLGSGYEGDTFAYNGSVIKVFKPGRSPLRNCIPDISPKMQWPPEIPVSLLLGGLQDPSDYAPTIPVQSNFIPVHDYFFLPTSQSSHLGEWYLVTPFLKSGTLEHLAKRLRQDDHPMTPDELDIQFRPSFDRLLQALYTMHVEHDLCHDDIKMDNVFVARQVQPSETTLNSSVFSGGEEAHWMIADLGNARQPSHKYHSSLLWTHDNDQHPDCRVNDVVRLVKSYMSFLQSASSAKKGAFNEPFLTAAAPWSQLYWYTVNSARLVLRGATAAQQVREMSSNAFAPSSTASDKLRAPSGTESADNKERDGDIHRFARPILEATWSGFGGSARKALMVRRELKAGMSVSEKWAKIFGTMGFLSTPSYSC